MHYTLCNLVSKHELGVSYSIYATAQYMYVYTHTFGEVYWA